MATHIVVMQAHWVCDLCADGQGYEGEDALMQAQLHAGAHEEIAHGKTVTYRTATT